jgi:hypothetical protein
MHGASAVAQVPNRIEKVFLNDSLSKTGIYGCQMYALGVPVTVTVDDEIPLDEDGHAVFADVGSDQALWPLVLEKCFAKLNGNYEAIVGGDPADSVRALNGSPAKYTSHTEGMKDGKEVSEIDALWQEITSTIATRGMVSGGTPGTSNTGRTASSLA